MTTRMQALRVKEMPTTSTPSMANSKMNKTEKSELSRPERRAPETCDLTNPDVARLMSMPEFKREAILTKRMEAIQKEVERQKLEKLVKSQASGGGSNNMDVDGPTARRKQLIVLGCPST